MATADKLLIKPGSTVWLSEPARAPLVDLPADVRLAPSIAEAQVAVVFCGSAADLRATLMANASGLTAPAVLWIAYPKGNRADINRDSLWPILAAYGLRPITQVSLDEEWSALRFRPLKPGEEMPAAR